MKITKTKLIEIIREEYNSIMEKKERPCPPNRKSPCESASNFKEGTVRKGEDGRPWEVTVTSKGVHRWKRVKLFWGKGVRVSGSVDGPSRVDEMRSHTSKDLPTQTIIDTIKKELDWENEYLGSKGMKKLEKDLKKVKRMSATDLGKHLPGYIPSKEIFGIFKNHLAMGPDDK
jgi:hypothetical protein